MQQYPGKTPTLQYTGIKCLGVEKKKRFSQGKRVQGVWKMNFYQKPLHTKSGVRIRQSLMFDGLSVYQVLRSHDGLIPHLLGFDRQVQNGEIFAEQIEAVRQC